MTPYPALDFLRKVEMWQQAPGGTAGLAVPLPEGEDATLARMLSQFLSSGPTAQLEIQARYWLIGYRETNPPLTNAQRAELDEAIGAIPPPGLPAGPSRVPHTGLPGFRIAAAMLIVLALVFIVAFTITALPGSGNGSPVPAGQAQPAVQPQQQAPALTPLQQFRQDWNVPAGATADAGNPQALVLLQNGLYYPAGWKLPAHDASWAPDISGSISNITVKGTSAIFTDTDGNTWAIAAGQPFVLSSGPGTVFRITGDGTVQSILTSHAIVVRAHL